MIDFKEETLLNNTGRVHFIAQENSFELLNFLEINDEKDNSYIDKDEEKEYDNKFREIIQKVNEDVFPMDQIISLISDIKSRPSICELEGIIHLTMMLNNILPKLDNHEQKSCIFRLFQKLMYNSKNLTDYLIDNYILENICSTLCDENIPDKDKIPPIRCIHYIASYGNPLKIFDVLSFTYKKETRRLQPFECMIDLILDQNQKQDPDDTLAKIRKCSGPSFEEDDTMKLRYLILKFLVAILNEDNLPRYPADEIVNHIIDYTIQYHESVITKEISPLKFLDTAAFGCFLAAINKNTKLCFLNAFKAKNCIMNFINILDNNKDYPHITPSILLCLKSIVDDIPREADNFYKYNIIAHIKNHILSDKNPIICENAIQTIISFLQTDTEKNKQYHDNIIEEKIPDILYDNLVTACFSVKIASLLGIYEIIQNLWSTEVWAFITKFNEIFERCCSLLQTELDYHSLKIVTQTASILANAYNKAGENEKLLEIVQNNEIHLSIDNYFLSDADYKTQSLAVQLKRIINLEDEGENET